MNRTAVASVVAALALSAGAAMGQTTYTDPVGDTFTTAGGGILDILQMEVSNTLTDIQFKFTLGGDVVATDWGKYMIIIDRAAGGDTAGNGWNRPISMPTGADSWIGSWVDGGNGAELYQFGAGWSRTQATYDAAPNNQIAISKSGNTVTITTPLSAIGLSLGQTFLFDAFTSGGGGGDGAVDSLGNPGQQIADWGNPSDAHPVQYTVVPAPAGAAVLGLAGIAALRRRR